MNILTNPLIFICVGFLACRVLRDVGVPDLPAMILTILAGLLYAVTLVTA